MKRYKIIKEVYLDFLTARDQVTLAFTEGFVETEGNTSWYVAADGERRETINYDWVIQQYANKGYLELVNL